MRIFVLYFILFALGANSKLLNAQQLKKEFDAVYSMNPELYNGRIFTEVYRGNVSGSQFFSKEEFQYGDLGLNHQIFKNQELNYDVHRQKILLSFKNDINARVVIEVPLLNTQFFFLGNKYFEVLQMEDSKKIFQVFGDERCKILIQWSKSLSIKSYSGNYLRKFSKLKKQIWFLKDGEYHAIKNNKSFIKLFEPERQADLERWLKSNRIKIQKADDIGMNMIVEFCGQ